MRRFKFRSSATLVFVSSIAGRGLARRLRCGASREPEHSEGVYDHGPDGEARRNRQDDGPSPEASDHDDKAEETPGSYDHHVTRAILPGRAPRVSSAAMSPPSEIRS